MIVKVLPTKEIDKPTYVRIFSAFPSVLKMNTKNRDSIIITEKGYVPYTRFNTDGGKSAPPIHGAF